MRSEAFHVGSHGGQSGPVGREHQRELERRRGRLTEDGPRDLLEELVGKPVTVTDRPEVAAAAGDAASWLASTDRPELRALDAQEEAVRADARRLAREARPEPTVWAGYRLRFQENDGADLASVGVSMPIPVASGRRQSGLSAAREQQADGVSARSEGLERQIARELADAESRWRRAEERARVYGEQLVPEARAARDATLSDYRVDKAAFADVLEAEVAVLALERVAIQAAAETQLQKARVQGVTGVEPR